MEKKCPTYETKGAHSMIVYTSELDNCLRSGVPPMYALTLFIFEFFLIFASIPDYTRASLWRNEGVDLQDLANEGETFDEVIVGISWCQAKGSSSVDLDLTLLLFDENWKFVTECGFRSLTAPGCTHSGDVRSAPFPSKSLSTSVLFFVVRFKMCAYPSPRRSSRNCPG